MENCSNFNSIRIDLISELSEALVQVLTRGSCKDSNSESFYELFATCRPKDLKLPLRLHFAGNINEQSIRC